MRRLIENHFGLVAFLLLIIYALTRLPSFLSDIGQTGAITHDSAYLMIVARNLVDGLGFVNQAHWLIFLNPEHLPMPYHNANPLFPVLVATISGMTGVSGPLIGALIALLGHLILIASLYSLSRTVGMQQWQAFAASCVGAVLQPQWQESLTALPDSLATGLMFAMFAVALRPGGSAKWWLAGILLGLSWLTRTTLLLVMPGFFVWCWFEFGLKQSIKHFIRLGIPAFLLASPWLWHTWSVWGNPFRSDASFYWFQDYYAHIAGYGVGEYWRSVQPPPSIKEAIMRDPIDFFSYWILGIPKTFYNWLSLWNQASKAAAVIFLLALGCGAWAARTWLRQSIAWMCIATGVLTFLSLGIRPDTVELRYLDPVNVVLTFVLMAPLIAYESWKQRLLWAAPLGLYLFVFVLPQDLEKYRFSHGTNESVAPLRQASMDLAVILPPDATVVSPFPYYTSYFSRLRTIAPPYPGLKALISTMNKYQSSYLLLPSAGMKDFYAGAPNSLEPYFVKIKDYGMYVLYERTARQTPNTDFPIR